MKKQHLSNNVSFSGMQRTTHSFCEGIGTFTILYSGNKNLRFKFASLNTIENEHLVLNVAVLSHNSKGCRVVPFSIDLQHLYISSPFSFTQWEELSCKIVVLIQFILFCSRSGDEITVQEPQLCVNVCVCGRRKENFLSHFNSHSAPITMIQHLCVS